MSNTAIVSKTKTKSLPHFPSLPVGKSKRIVTKHWTNLALWLSADEFALFNFLVYQTQSDNTFKYSTKLLEKFIAAKKNAYFEYKRVELDYPPHLYHVRQNFVGMINLGLIIHTNRRHVYMISPMLTYDTFVINRKQYNEFQEQYQRSSPEKVVQNFTTLVASYLSKKKKNYRYGKV